MPTEKLRFDKYEITVNPENLRFDENTLGAYIQTEGGHYDNIGGYLALSERHLQNKEVQYEKLFCERFEEAKEHGASDKLAEAKAKKDPDVVDKKLEVVEARYIVNRLKNHVKAWDKNHDNAQSLGHMLRKQMDKLNADIRAHDDRFGYDRHHEDPFPAEKREPVKSEFASELTADHLF